MRAAAQDAMADGPSPPCLTTATEAAAHGAQQQREEESS